MDIVFISDFTQTIAPDEEIPEVVEENRSKFAYENAERLLQQQ
ncbi:MAG: hypothetical protein AABX33_00565 [Nanoarchaeota archaeon]